MIRHIFFALASLTVLVVQCQSKYGREELKLVPEAPDYKSLDFWVAHPNKSDQADEVPGKGEISEQQEQSSVDVFFVYPTIYSKRQKATNPWFADVFDEKLNAQIANSTIRNQASVFNGSAKVYSPLYRQAHIRIFKTEDLILKQKALDVAYEDVKLAFQYFLDEYHEGRPFIIASHSQGTLHAARLIRDFIDEKPLAEKLVAAYLVGMPLAPDVFEQIPPCQKSGEVGCWVSWNTYAKKYYPKSVEVTYRNALSTNPLTWRLDESYAPNRKNLGGVLRNFRKIRPEVTDGQNHRGVLWISKPRFFGNFLMFWKRYHIADYNLFYMNIRANVADQITNYFER